MKPLNNKSTIFRRINFVVWGISLLVICIAPSWWKINNNIVRYTFINAFISQIVEFIIVPMFFSTSIVFLKWRNIKFNLHMIRFSKFLFFWGMCMLLVGIYISIGFVMFEVWFPLPLKIGIIIMENSEINTLWWCISLILILVGYKYD